ncbi:MAG: GIN domain-containing protein [Pseudomonadota bacterium]
MQRIILPLLCGAAFLAAPALAAEKSYDFGKIRAIDAGGAMALDISFGPRQSVVVEEPEGRFDELELSLDDGVLDIDQRSRGRKDSGEFTIRLTLDALEALDLSGAVKTSVKGYKGEQLAIDASGAVQLILAGECTRLSLDLSGAVKLDGKDFKCQDVSIDISGAGAAQVYASQSLRIDSSGAAKVTAYGKPSRIEKDMSGVAQVIIAQE